MFQDDNSKNVLIWLNPKLVGFIIHIYYEKVLYWVGKRNLESRTNSNCLLVV